MSLRRKTFIAMLVGLSTTILVLYLVISTVVTESFLLVDRQAALRNLDRTTNTLRDNVEALKRSLTDWASWDETYQFVQGSNPEYIENNLRDDTILNLDVNLMIFLDDDNQ